MLVNQVKNLKPKMISSQKQSGEKYLDRIRSLKPMDRLVHWITEREKIRLAKASGKPAPWTDDEILQSFRFTNVRRMDDKVSVWLYTNWYRPNLGHRNMVVACTMARLLNRIETLEAVGFPKVWRPDRVKVTLDRLQASGAKIYSAAYMITGTFGGTKNQQVVYRVCDALYRNPPTVDSDSMERTWRGLYGRPGMGSFIAGQVTADLRWAVSGRWLDRNEWAPLGPGSAKGLARLLYAREDWENVARSYRSTSEAKDGPGAWLEDFQDNYLSVVRKKLPAGLRDRLEAMDFQNCLCEFFKYERTLWGEGRAKQKYPGGG